MNQRKYSDNMYSISQQLSPVCMEEHISNVSVEDSAPGTTHDESIASATNEDPIMALLESVILTDENEGKTRSNIASRFKPRSRRVCRINNKNRNNLIHQWAEVDGLLATNGTDETGSGVLESTLLREEARLFPKRKSNQGFPTGTTQVTTNDSIREEQSSRSESDEDSLTMTMKSIAYHHQTTRVVSTTPNSENLSVLHGENENDLEPSTNELNQSYLPVSAHSEWALPRENRKEEGESTSIGHKSFSWFEVVSLTVLALLITTLVSVLTVAATGERNQVDVVADIATPENFLSGNSSNHTNIGAMKRYEIQSLLNVDPQPGSYQARAIDFLAFQDVDYHIPLNEIIETRKKSTAMKDSYIYQRLKQRYALLTLYFATEEFSNVGGWGTIDGTRLHECWWPGNHCDGPGNYDTVNRIDIYYRMGLMGGSIPTEIGLLTNLEKIFLTYNVLRGEIPTELFQLSRLYAISFFNSNLSSTISPLFSKLSKLEYLDLSNSGAQGTIPSELGKLTHLRFLQLSMNLDLYGPIPRELGHLTFLEKATFYHTHLTGSLPDTVCRLREHRLKSLVVNPCDGVEVNCTCCTECFSPSN